MLLPCTTTVLKVLRMSKTLTALSRAVAIIGCVSAILFGGCTSSRITSPSSVIQGVPSSAPQGYVDPFSLSTKNFIHKYALGSITPIEMATGSDKNVWFTDLQNTKIGKITQSGVVTEYAIPSGSTAQDIAPAAGGMLVECYGSPNVTVSAD